MLQTIFFCVGDFLLLPVETSMAFKKVLNSFFTFCFWVTCNFQELPQSVPTVQQKIFQLSPPLVELAVQSLDIHLWGSNSFLPHFVQTGQWLKDIYFCFTDSILECWITYFFCKGGCHNNFTHKGYWKATEFWR